MSNKKLTILGIVAAVMIIWAIVQSRIANRPLATSQQEPSPLIQGLETGKIASIELVSPDNTVTLKHQGKRFVVVNKDNYPAEVGVINYLVTSCLDIRTAEWVTKDPAYHTDLGVAEDNARSIVKFLDEQGQPITGIIVGNSVADVRGTYVRRLASDDVYVSTNTPWLRMSAMDYINKQLFKVNRKDIAKVEVNSPEGGYVIAVQSDDGSVVALQNIPPGKKVKGNDYERVFRAITTLEMADVQKESAETSELNFNRTFVCYLKDATVCKMALAQKENKTYVKCWAEFTESAPRKAAGEESQEELKKKEAIFLARDAAQAFTERHRGWVYELSSWQAENLTKKLDDLIEDEKPAEPQQANSTEKTAETEETPITEELDQVEQIATPAQPEEQTHQVTTETK